MPSRPPADGRRIWLPGGPLAAAAAAPPSVRRGLVVLVVGRGRGGRVHGVHQVVGPLVALQALPDQLGYGVLRAPLQLLKPRRQVPLQVPVGLPGRQLGDLLPEGGGRSERAASGESTWSPVRGAGDGQGGHPQGRVQGLLSEGQGTVREGVPR